MAKIGCQRRHLTLDIHVRSRPTQKSLGSETVSQIMQSWSPTAQAVTQSDPTRNLTEGLVDLSRPKLMAPPGQQGVRCPRTGAQTGVAPREVVLQRAPCRLVQWNETRLAELATADGQHAGGQIHIVVSECKRFIETHPGDREQPDERAQGPGSKRLARAQLAGGGHQCANLAASVVVGLAPLRAKRQQAHLGHFGGGIKGLQVARKLTHAAQAAGPRSRLNVRQRRCPLECECRANRSGAARVHELAEPAQVNLRQHQPKPERPAHLKIVLEPFVKEAHGTPPGHRIASVRKRVRSTLA